MSDQSLEWMRAYRDETDVSRRRTWRSRCRRYVVQESESKYEKDDKGRAVVRFYAILVAGQVILGRHRKKARAQKTCENHAKKH